jgi:predicted DNA-binding transcriptional regulator AlpA
VRAGRIKADQAESIPVKEPDFGFDFALRPRQVAQAMGIGLSTLYKMVAEGAFPKPQKLGLRISFWRTSTVNAWLDRQRSG